MAARAVVSGKLRSLPARGLHRPTLTSRLTVPDGDEADRFNWFCDQHRAALDFSQIGRVRQVVTEDKLRSEFEVVAGFTLLAAGLPATVTGKIVSTADILRSKTSERALAPDEVRGCARKSLDPTIMRLACCYLLKDMDAYSLPPRRILWMARVVCSLTVSL